MNPSDQPASAGATRVLLAVEQLRRDVPGGIGTYARGLMRGLTEIRRQADQAGSPEQAGSGDQAEQSEPADRDGRPNRGGQPSPTVEIGLLASRAPIDGHGRARQPRRSDGRAAGPDRAVGGDRAGSPRSDPLLGFGWPVHASRLPGRLLTRAWDHGVGAPPAGYDVVHAVSLAAPPVRGRHGVARPTLVVTVHDLAWRHHPDATTPRGRRWHEASLGRALRHADALVVPSTPVADDLLEAGAAPERVTVIDEGADHLPPADGPGATALLRARGVAGGYLLTVGTLQPRKNLARLVAAYEAVRPSLPEPWPLVVVGATGWGAATPSNERAGRSWRDVLATEGVVAVGAVPDEVLAGLYAGARAFVYVPLAEGFGLPPLEAMTFGVPVVASSAVPSVHRAPGAPPTALVVDPLDADAIAEALATVSTDDEIRRTLTTAGSADVGRRTWARAAAAHVGLWRTLRTLPTR